MGYSGGTTRNPEYHNLGDHAETIQIVYDQTILSYRDLLDLFWSGHRPTRRPWSRQYISAIFYHNSRQKTRALQAKEEEAVKRDSEVYTEIISFERFYPAENYHQKHALQRYPDLLKEYRTIYPDMRDFNASTAVARVNGYLAGYGRCDRLKTEIDSLGLSSSGRKKLLSIICGSP